MDFYGRIEDLAKKDPRYKADAYEFVMQALGYTQKTLKHKGHVSGRELLEGIRRLGITQFGSMVKVVFEHWGVKTTGDFGEIVFNMVGDGLMGKTDKDSRDDFKNVYDFEKVFDIQDKFWQLR